MLKLKATSNWPTSTLPHGRDAFFILRHGVEESSELEVGVY